MINPKDRLLSDPPDELKTISCRLPISLIQQRQSELKIGDLLYLGDMSNRRHIFNPVDHFKCTKQKEYLGSNYLFYDGSPAYIEVFSCQCCRSGEHYFLAASKNDGVFVGFICVYCSKIREEMTQEELDTYRDIIFEGVGR